EKEGYDTKRAEAARPRQRILARRLVRLQGPGTALIAVLPKRLAASTWPRPCTPSAPGHEPHTKLRGREQIRTPASPGGGQCPSSIEGSQGEVLFEMPRQVAHGYVTEFARFWGQRHLGVGTPANRWRSCERGGVAQTMAQI